MANIIQPSDPSPTPITGTTPNSLRSGATPSIPTTSNDVFLNSLGRKILDGGIMTPEESIRLETISSTKQTVFSKVRSQFGQTKVIDTVRAQILKDGGTFQTNQTKVRQLVEVQGERSVDEQRALANLLGSYQESQVPYYARESAQLRSKHGSNIPLEEVNKLINNHNRISAPKPSRAGSVATVIGDHKLSFNKEGFLELTPSTSKSVRPFSAATNPALSETQKEMLKKEYEEVAKSPYNNLGPMMEFMRYFRECKTLNPDLSLAQAYETFSVRGIDLYKKYQSGDCVALTGVLQHQFRELGVTAAGVGECTGPDWALAPIPNPHGKKGLPWPSYDQQTENVHHCSTLVPYQDANGVTQAMAFDITFSEGNQGPGGGVDEKPLQEFESRQGKLDTKGDITNVDNLIKMQMKGKTKMVIGGKERSQVLGVDLLHGNIYLNSKGSEGLSGLPLNADGRFSISLTDLQNPSQIGTYFIHGEATEMTHAEALDLFSKVAGERFQLPEDFAENMQTLASQQEALFSTVLIPPAETVKATKVEVEKANRMAIRAKAIATECTALLKVKPPPPEGVSSQMSQCVAKDKELAKHFKQMQQALFAENPEEVKRLAAIITQISAEILTLKEEMSKGCLLDNQRG